MRSIKKLYCAVMFCIVFLAISILAKSIGPQEETTMSKLCSYKFLVIDNKDILEINNLQRKVNQAIKHPAPILKLDAPWEDSKNFCLAYLNVLYDEDEKLFKMWYIVGSLTRKGMHTSGWKEEELKENEKSPSPPVAYATSKDGIHWDKPILNIMEFRGSKTNNYVLPPLDISIIRDSSDPACRRYKMLFADGSANWAKFHMPLSLAYSADGIQWDVPAHVNPVHRGVSDGAWEFFYDEDRRKYQIYSRRVPNLPRDISLYESYDLVNWEDKGRVLVPGDEYDPADAYNFHGMVPFKYEDFRLGLLNTMYSLPVSETYEVYNAPPPDYPNKRLGKTDIQLSYSRDGVNWSRPKDRSPIVPNGEPGSPDEGHIFAHAGRPFVLNGETWIYYVGLRNRHNYWATPSIMKEVGWDWRKIGFGMLAKMPEDHWISLDADSNEGSFVCKPWGPPHEIFVNADAEGGSIEAELITPYGEPVPEFARKDCIPVTGNGKNQEIKWKCGRNPWDFQKQYLGGVLVRFHLKNAKLYSYTFTLPDPDGQLERNRLNARWCNHIKHRSGNWDRNSNEPAIGVPPYQEPCAGK